MKRTSVVLLGIILMVNLSILGCTKKAASSQEAIAATQTMKTVDEKVNYLVGQANAFINSKEFDQAIQTAQYILSNLDKNSTAAQGIIEKAKAELTKAAQSAMQDVKSKLGSFGK
ncbi:MAG TPA: hypothetical protein PL155_01605 [Candidatus Omnitrophota bacterium]|nr:hypothetical protein [Candidatus Omnitrophota bacterium]HPD84817.1 hypothetical protein [Candidatus Omnitrophota bacterium]HRZ03675.1 hypothetical protein [Candidatus Omnitrophota bacterium]